MAAAIRGLRASAAGIGVVIVLVVMTVLSPGPACAEESVRYRIGAEIKAGDEGVAVIAVVPGAPADGKLQAGDVITGVGGEPVTSAEAVVEAVQQAGVQGRKSVLLRIERKGAPAFVTVALDRVEVPAAQTAEKPVRPKHNEAIDKVIANLAGNEFVISRRFENGTEQTLAVDIAGNVLSLNMPALNDGSRTCTFIDAPRSGEGDGALYLDHDCDGVLDVFSSGDHTTDDMNIVHEMAYGLNLLKFVRLSEITRSYLKNNPAPARRFSHDRATMARNRDLFIDIYNHVTKIPYLEYKPARWCFPFRQDKEGSHIALDFCFAVDKSAMTLESCLIRDRHEGQLIIHRDFKCDGFFEYFLEENAQGDQRSGEYNYGMAAVQNALLRDILRFAEFTAKYYAR